MRPDLNRRGLIGAALVALPLASARAAAPDPHMARLVEIERATGGRLGVLALDTGSGRRLEHRALERFPMCSTFKWLLAAAVLNRVDRGAEHFDRRIAYGKTDLLPTSPTTQAHVAEGGMSVAGLCEAAVTRSDNAAANLLLASLGGPAGLTGWLRAAGDVTTRLDHNEPALNNPPPGDPHDTTTPAATVANLRKFILGDGLSKASRARLTGWLVANKTGDARLRAGLPAGWRVGDKTGAWSGVTANDLAITWPPNRAPILMAVYSTRGGVSDDARNASIAEVARIVATAFGGAA